MDAEPRELTRLRADNANLRRAIETRDTIGMAKGILIERVGLTPEEAFAWLTRESQRTNTKLHIVARRLVDDATDPERDGAWAATGT